MLEARLYQIEYNIALSVFNITDPLDVVDMNSLEESLEVDAGQFEVGNIDVTVTGLAESHLSDAGDVNRPFVLEIVDNNDIVFHGPVDPESIEYNEKTKYTAFTATSWEYFLRQAGSVPARSIYEATIQDAAITGIHSTWTGTKGLIELMFNADVPVQAGDVIKYTTDDGDRRDMVTTVTQTADYVVAKLLANVSYEMEYLTPLNANLNNNFNLEDYFAYINVTSAIVADRMRKEYPATKDLTAQTGRYALPENTFIEMYDVNGNRLEKIPVEKIVYYSEEAQDVYGWPPATIVLSNYIGNNTLANWERGVFVNENIFAIEDTAESTAQIYGRVLYATDGQKTAAGKYLPYYNAVDVVDALLRLQEPSDPSKPFGVWPYIVDQVTTQGTGFSALPREVELPEDPLSALRLIQLSSKFLVRFEPKLVGGMPRVDVKMIHRDEIDPLGDIEAVTGANITEWKQKPGTRKIKAVTVKANAEYQAQDGDSEFLGIYFDGIDNLTIDDLDVMGRPSGAGVLELEIAVVPAYSGSQVFHGEGTPVVNDEVLKEFAKYYYEFYRQLTVTVNNSVAERNPNFLGKYVTFSEGGISKTLLITKVNTNLGHNTEQTDLEGLVGPFTAPAARPPVARIDGARSVPDYENDGSQLVSLSGRRSYDPQGYNLTYAWDYRALGATTWTAGGDDVLFEQLLAVGGWEVRLTVTSSQTGLSDSLTEQVVVHENTPTTATNITDGFDVEKFEWTADDGNVWGVLRLFPKNPSLVKEVRFRRKSGGELPEIDWGVNPDPATNYPEVITPQVFDKGVEYRAHVLLHPKHNSNVELYIEFIPVSGLESITRAWTFDIDNQAEIKYGNLHINSANEARINIKADDDTSSLVVRYGINDDTVPNVSTQNTDLLTDYLLGTVEPGETIYVEVEAYTGTNGTGNKGDVWIDRQANKESDPANFEDGSILASKLQEEAQGYTLRPATAGQKIFSSTTPDTISWNSFDLVLHGGRAYNDIPSGSFTVGSDIDQELRFVFYDTENNWVARTTDLNIILTTQKRILIGVAKYATPQAFYVMGDAEMHITAAEIDVIDLQAITTNTGNLTVDKQLTMGTGAIITNFANEVGGYQITDQGIQINRVGKVGSELVIGDGKLYSDFGYLYIENTESLPIVIITNEERGLVVNGNRVLTEADDVGGGGLDEYVTTAQHGAVADGTTDDTAAVQAAMDAAAAEGKVLLISDGVHSISYLEVTQGVKGIIGVGSLKGRSFALGLISSTHSDTTGAATKTDFFIHNVELDTNNAAQRGIWLTNAKRVEIRGCYIHGQPSKGGIRANYNCEDITIDGNIITDLPSSDTVGIQLFGQMDGEIKNRNDRGTDGYMIETSGTVSGGVLTVGAGDADSGDVPALAAIVNGTSRWYYDVTGYKDSSSYYVNKVGGDAGDGSGTAYISTGNTKRTKTYYPKRITITNNKVDGGYYSVGTGRSEDIIIANNYFTNNMRNLHMGYTERATVTGNILLNAVAAAINMSYGTRLVTISGNFMYSYVNHGGDNGGIVSYVHTEDNTIMNNHIQGNWKFGYYNGCGGRRDRVIGNTIVGMQVGICIENDFYEGGSPYTLGRDVGAVWPRAMRDTSSHSIKNNTIVASSADIFLGEFTTEWGDHYDNKNHVLDGNSEMQWASDVLVINDVGGVNGITFTNFASDAQKDSTDFSLSRGRSHFYTIKNVVGLDDEVLHPIHTSTPSVLAGPNFYFNNGSPTTVTNFDDGKNQQHIFIKGDNNTTIQHGTYIMTKSGSDITTTSNAAYHFVRMAGVWYEV